MTLNTLCEALGKRLSKPILRKRVRDAYQYAERLNDSYFTRHGCWPPIHPSKRWSKTFRRVGTVETTIIAMAWEGFENRHREWKTAYPGENFQ